MAFDVPTLLASAGLSLAVSVAGSGLVVRRQARANRALDARAAIRAAVLPLQQETALWWRQGINDRHPGVPSRRDPEVVTTVLRVLPDLPGWRQRRVRKRLRVLFGELWPSFSELWPWGGEDHDMTMTRAEAYEHRAQSWDGQGPSLTDGLVHRTLEMTVYGGEPLEKLERELRLLAAAR